MAKVSRPMVYTGLAAVVAYAIFLYATPDNKTTAKHVVRMTSTRAVDPNGVDPRDLEARFAPYTGGKRDPFTPKVVIKKAFTAVTVRAAAAQGKWALTGVSEIDGVRSALVENSTSGDSVFLKSGDRWNGLRVLSVDDEQIVFANALGQQTKLAFSDNDPPADDETRRGIRNRTGNATVPSAPPLPDNAIRPLPPLQIVPTATSRIDSQGNSNQP